MDISNLFLQAFLDDAPVYMRHDYYACDIFSLSYSAPERTMIKWNHSEFR